MGRYRCGFMDPVSAGSVRIGGVRIDIVRVDLRIGVPVLSPLPRGT